MKKRMCKITAEFIGFGEGDELIAPARHEGAGEVFFGSGPTETVVLRSPGSGAGG